MEDLTKHYKTLDVNPDAPFQDIVQAYHDLVNVWKPDQFKNDPSLKEKAQAKIREINTAYEKIAIFKKGYCERLYDVPNTTIITADKSANHNKLITPESTSFSSVKDLNLSVIVTIIGIICICGICVFAFTSGLGFFEHKKVESNQNSENSSEAQKSVSMHLNRYNWAYQYSQAGSYEKSIEEFTKIIKEDPQDGFAYLCRAEDYYNSKKYLLAIEDTKKGLELGAKGASDDYPYIIMGRSYYNMTMYAEAVMAFDKAIELGTKDKFAYLLGSVKNLV